MIKAVLFDFDGVLTTDKTGSVSTIRSLSRQTGLAEGAVWDAFAPFNEQLLLGHTTHDAVWPEICARLGRELDPAVLVQAFESTPIRHDMLAYAAELSSGYATAVITDNKADRMSCLNDRYSLASIFSLVLVSADHGSGKEHTSIFERAVDLLGVEPEQCVFIDNSQRNLVAPAALGINTVYFNEAADTAQSLAQMLSSRHGVAAPRVTPNNSSKPTPLRGAA
ncbi:HAD family phosphatase [Thermomonas sp.]|uniref:HAD family hydrolase n=1 Tax=Thermomonas sp. TaxID=1971895 RepID=UPI00258103B9|nr:HAD family phosphatase [Thermomonas sp.]